MLISDNHKNIPLLGLRGISIFSHIVVQKICTAFQSHRLSIVFPQRLQNSDIHGVEFTKYLFIGILGKDNHYSSLCEIKISPDFQFASMGRKTF